jgi:signal transduction histidine kinase
MEGNTCRGCRSETGCSGLHIYEPAKSKAGFPRDYCRDKREGGAIHRAVNRYLKICVFSNDLKLLDVCLEVANGLSLEDCEVVRADPDSMQTMAADLFIWDLEHKAWPVDGLRGFRRGDAQDQLFVVDRRHVDEFLRKLPLGPGSTLIKPVGRPTLQIFIEQAALRAGAKQTKTRSIRSSSESANHDLLQCLLMANLKLQEYDQNRTNFMARAVHDFRAPLTAASGYCGLLSEEALGPLNDDQIDLLHRISHSLSKLTRMASEMFALSMGRQSDRRLELKESSIEACVRHALHEIEPLAGEKKIAVTLNLKGVGAPLYLDSEQIEQVLVNLLENACKFTPKGGEVHVNGYPTIWAERMGYPPQDGADENGHQSNFMASETAYRIDVSDTGSGISAGHLEDVFEEYTSYSGSQDRSGGGLGLAICKMILTAHGGQIWAENHRAGAQLSFVLPLGDLSSRRPVKFHRQLHAVSLREASFTEGRSCN